MKTKRLVNPLSMLIAGLVLGAAVGMAVSPRRKSMKTCVGRTMQQMGNAVDEVWEDLLRTMK